MYHQMITFTAPNHVPDEFIDQYINTKIGEFLTKPDNTHPSPMPNRGFEKLIYVNERTLIGIYRSTKPHYPSPREIAIFEGKPQMIFTQEVEPNV